MKASFLPFVAFAALVLTTSLPAQEAKPSAADDLQAKFKEAMTGVTLSGRWCSIKDGVLGEEKDDRYEIVSVEHVVGDDWTVNVRLKRGNQEFVAPLPVKIKWAGDTAVLSVDGLKMPGSGAYGTGYTARVLFYGNTYAGTWSGGDHGGLLKGAITKAPTPTPATATTPATKPEEEKK